jgi:hypothetical protein
MYLSATTASASLLREPSAAADNEKFKSLLQSMESKKGNTPPVGNVSPTAPPIHGQLWV